MRPSAVGQRPLLFRSLPYGRARLTDQAAVGVGWPRGGEARGAPRWNARLSRLTQRRRGGAALQPSSVPPFRGALARVHLGTMVSAPLLPRGASVPCCCSPLGPAEQAGNRLFRPPPSLPTTWTLAAADEDARAPGPVSPGRCCARTRAGPRRLRTIGTRRASWVREAGLRWAARGPGERGPEFQTKQRHAADRLARIRAPCAGAPPPPAPPRSVGAHPVGCVFESAAVASTPSPEGVFAACFVQNPPSQAAAGLRRLVPLADRVLVRRVVPELKVRCGSDVVLTA